MGVLSITPSLEFRQHGFLPEGPEHGQPLRVDPRIHRRTADGQPQMHQPGVRDGPVTSHFIHPLIYFPRTPPPFPHETRHDVTGRVDPKYVEQQNVKRRLHPIAQSVKRPRN